MMSNRFYIYCHRRKTDGKCFYIGKGTSQRYKTKYGRNQHWWNIVNKHGFEAEILVNNIYEQKAFELEAYFCNQIGYENLSNLNKELGNGGHSLSDESKIKISNKKINHPCYNDVWRQKIKKGNEGKVCSEVTKQKIRKPKTEEHKLNMKKPKGPQSLETIRKRKNSLKGKSKPKGMMEKIHKLNKKPILQYDLQGNFIKEWDSIKDAGLYIGKKGAAIGECCQEKRKTAYNYIWKFKLS